MNPIPVENQRTLPLCAATKSISSFEALYDKYAPALLGVIHTVIPDQHAAIEVLQLSFIQIWERMDEHHAVKLQLFTWMYQLTKSEACKYKHNHPNYSASIAKQEGIKKAVVFNTIAKNYSPK